jgi:sugar/nucleoside kinase (ribokinase family)
MDVLVTGYPSIDHIARVSRSPAVGETARLFEVPDQMTYGGCGTNVGAALARLGFRVGAAIVLGDDRYGANYLRYLAALGIDTTNVTTLPGELTSHSFLFLNPDGQCQNFFLPGAADAWRGPLALSGLESYRFALVSVGQVEYNRQFVAQVSAAGVPLVWAMKPDIVAYPPEMIGEFLAASAYVVMNHIEAEYVLRALERRLDESLIDETTRAVVITRGGQGAQVHTRERMTVISAVPPREVVDPTGAGDGFTAGFLAGLLRGAPPEVSAKLGAVVASFVLEAVGCQTNLPDWPQALARYKQHFGHFAGER